MLTDCALAFSTCANLKSMYLFVQFKFQYMATHKRTNIHVSCNAVLLVWGSLRLAPIKSTTHGGL